MSIKRQVKVAASGNAPRMSYAEALAQDRAKLRVEVRNANEENRGLKKNVTNLEAALVVALHALNKIADGVEGTGTGDIAARAVKKITTGK